MHFKLPLSKSERKSYKILLPHFDNEYYRSNYSHFLKKDEDPLRHYIEEGWRKGFNPARNFSSERYLNLYPDVKASGMNPFLHAIVFGKQEGRLTTFVNDSGHTSCLSEEGVDNSIAFDFAFFRKNNPFFSHLKNDEILRMVYQKDSIHRLTLFPTRAEDARSYCVIARGFEENGEIDKARQLYLISISFAPNSKAFHALGDLSFKKGEYELANNFYLAAMQAGTADSWCVFNHAKALGLQGRFQDSIRFLIERRKEVEIDSGLEILLREQIYNFWADSKSLNQFYAECNERASLVNQTAKCSAQISLWFSDYFFFPPAAPQAGNSSIDFSIGIIGDFHISQCVRYRIDQKIEQLRFQGVKAGAKSWTDVEGSLDIIFNHSCIIFYRVPAVPSVIELIQRAKSIGKVTFYEIDDMLFLDKYPPPFDSYGEGLSINDYISLVRDMPLFREAMKLCDYGIASTNSLAEAMRPQFETEVVLVHRNGIDSKNFFQSYQYPQSHISIFYGSGTLAHNSDFNELIVPAMSKIFLKYRNVKLTIMGSLTLPQSFLEKYRSSIDFIAFTDNVEDYYRQLARADISMAVLQEDLINNCKSELKWVEAACLSIPCVVSKTRSYLDVTSHEENALHACNSDEWFEALSRLIESDDLRRTIGNNACRKVKREYSVERLGEMLVSNVESICRGNLKDNVASEVKKIALVNVFFAPQSIGGATRIVVDNFEKLKQCYGEKFDLCVFTTDAEAKIEHEFMVYNYHSCRVYQASVKLHENMDWKPLESSMFGVFSKFLELEKPDLVHFHCIQRITGAALEAVQIAEIPYVVTVHDAWWISDHQFLVDRTGRVFPDGHPQGMGRGALPSNVTEAESKYRDAYLKKLLAGAKRVLAVSQKFSEIYQKNGIPNVCVNENGLSDSVGWKEKNTDYTEKVVLGHVGGLSEHKGFHLFQSAILELQPRNVEIIIVNHALDSAHQEKDFWGDVPVLMVGKFPQNKVDDLYGMIDVLFAPSVWPESFGLVSREAAACGCWVVASSMGGIGDDVVDGKNGFVISPEKNEISRVVKLIESDPKKYKGAAPQVPVRRNSDQVEELIEIYSHCLS